MLRFIDDIIGMQVLSLQTGGPLGELTTPIINPHQLKIEAFYCQSSSSKLETALFSSDIRELTRSGAIVDDYTKLMTIDDDLVRLQDLIQLNFTLISKSVISNSGRKIGKVDTYTIDDMQFTVNKIYVQRRGLKGIGMGDLIIDRSQIIEVTDEYVMVKESTELAANLVAAS